MLAAIQHNLDPVLLELGRVYLYWYGAAYAVGIVGVLLFLLKRRDDIGLTAPQPLDLTLVFAVGMLLGGRIFEILVYERAAYAANPALLPQYWKGGMASHGVLLGAVAAVWIWCRATGHSVLRILDELVIPGAFFLALGRIGNSINGQIYGSPSDLPWAVVFPGEETPRHPVTLYESTKNFALIPILLVVRRFAPPGRGLMLGHFVLWWAFLRLLVDTTRTYGTTWLGIGTGQYYNIFGTVLGLALITWRWSAGRARPIPAPPVSPPVTRARRRVHVWITGALLTGVLFLCLTIPSSWTQGVLQQLRHTDSRPAPAASP